MPHPLAARRTVIAGIALLAAVASGACTAGSDASIAADATAPPPLSAAGGSVTTPDAAVAAVIAAEPRFAGIGPKDPQLIGQSKWYEVAPASGVGAFVVEHDDRLGRLPERLHREAHLDLRRRSRRRRAPHLGRWIPGPQR